MGDEEALALIEAHVGQMRLHVVELPAGLDVLEQRVDAAGKWFPVLVGMVKDLLAQCRAAIAEFLDEVNHVINSYTPFLSLIVRAFDWLDDVQQPVSHLAGVANETLGNENISYWEGDGYLKYNEKRVDQVAAMRAVAERASFVHGWLVEILAANILYTTKVVQQLARLVSEIVPIVAKAANPAAAPFAAGDLKDLVVTMVQTRAEEYSDIAIRLGDAVERTGKMTEQMSDHETFPGGRWPQAVA
jgi:hypothetical protein